MKKRRKKTNKEGVMILSKMISNITKKYTKMTPRRSLQLMMKKIMRRRRLMQMKMSVGRPMMIMMMKRSWSDI